MYKGLFSAVLGIAGGVTGDLLHPVETIGSMIFGSHPFLFDVLLPLLWVPKPESQTLPLAIAGWFLALFG